MNEALQAVVAIIVKIRDSIILRNRILLLCYICVERLPSVPYFGQGFFFLMEGDGKGLCHSIPRVGREWRWSFWFFHIVKQLNNENK